MLYDLFGGVTMTTKLEIKKQMKALSRSKRLADIATKAFSMTFAPSLAMSLAAGITVLSMPEGSQQAALALQTGTIGIGGAAACLAIFLPMLQINKNNIRRLKQSIKNLRLRTA